MEPSPAGQEAVFAAEGGPRPRRPVDLPRPPIHRPIVLASLGWIVGAVWGRALPAPMWSLLLPATGLILGSAAALILAARRDRVAQMGPGTGAALLAALTLLGWAASAATVRDDDQADSLAARFEAYEILRVEGRVAEPPRAGERSVSFTLDRATLCAPNGPPQPFPLKVSVSLLLRREKPVSGEEVEPDEARWSPPPPGTRVAVWGRLSRPQGKLFPGDFDQAAMLRGRGVGARLTAHKARDVELIAEAPRWERGLYGAISWAREGIRGRFEAALKPKQAALAMGLLLGDTTGLDQSDFTAFQRTGLIHILSVSGLHAEFILGITLLALRLLRAPPRVSALAALVVLGSYSLLTGLPPPVIRSAIMGAFLLVGWAWRRTATSLSALAASAWLTLALDPRNLLRADWQLSYICAVSLAVLAAPMMELASEDDDDEPAPAKTDKLSGLALARHRLTAVARWIASPLLVSLALQMGTLPLVVALFGQFSVVSIPAQIVMVPWATALLAGATVLALLGSIPGVGFLVGLAMRPATDGFMGVVGAMSGWRWSSVLVAPFPWWGVALWYGVLLFGPHLLRGRLGAGRNFAADPRQRRAMTLRAILFAVALAWLPLAAPGPLIGELELDVVDVGQGDGLVLRLPDGRVGVIDGGRRQGQADPPIVRFCRTLGLRKLDFVVATHADADHIGGLVPLMREFNVGLFIMGCDTSTSRDFADLNQTLRERKIPVEEARAGLRLVGAGDTEIRLLNPFPGEDNNDASVVMLVRRGKVRILLTGDIQSRAEREILGHGEAEDIDILKVAHHGSAGSSTDAFLDAFRPELALISVGRGNLYGHPSPRALDRLAAHGVQVARTDEMGTLRLLTDGDSYVLGSFQSGDMEIMR